MVPDSVYVRHILLQGDNAEKEADSLKNVIAKGGNFTSLASLYSADKNSARTLKPERYVSPRRLTENGL